MTAPTIAIVGGGITGLSAARTLLGFAPRPNVVLLEKSERLGGVVLTQDVDGAAVEAGPDWFLTRKPQALELARELGLGDNLVAPQRSGASIWSGGRLRPLPPGFVRGVPASPWQGWRAGLLTGRGALRAAADLLLPGRLTGADVSLGGYARRRLGTEVVERLVDPVVAAARAGRVADLSLAAAAPELDAVARTRASLIRGIRAQAAEPSPFLGIAGGMTRLIDALQNALGETDIRLSARVEKIAGYDRGFVLDSAEGLVRAQGLIVTTPAYVAAELLTDVDARAAELLGSITYASSAVVTLLYPPGASAPASGSGFLVPSSEGRVLTAAAWYSEKWPHARPASGGLIVRAFVGRAADDLPDRDDELVQAVAGELDEAAGLGTPVFGRVARWHRSLPQYTVGHLDKVTEIDKAVERLGPVALAGAGYRGSGLPDCIEQGQSAARAVALRLGCHEP